MSDSIAQTDARDEDNDAFVKSLFVDSIDHQYQATPQDLAFVDAVTQKNRSARRQRILRGLVLTAMLALLAIPGKEMALVFTEVALTQLFILDNTLVSILLAPVNTVGGVLSLLLFTLRMIYRRILY